MNNGPVLVHKSTVTLSQLSQIHVRVIFALPELGGSFKFGISLVTQQLTVIFRHMGQQYIANILISQRISLQPWWCFLGFCLYCPR